MKLTFEVHGYMITIEETEENTIKVSAMQDDEVVEEFELEGGEDHEDMGNEEGMEELPEEGEEDMDIEGGEEEEEEDFGAPAQAQAQAPIGEAKLESFASFLRKKK